MPIFLTILAVVKCEDIDTWQTDELLVALEVDKLSGPDMLNTEVIADLMLRSSKSTHVDADLSVAVQLFVVILAIGPVLEPSSVLGESRTESLAGRCPMFIEDKSLLNLLLVQMVIGHEISGSS